MNTRKIIAISAALILSVLAVQAQTEGPGGVGSSRGLKLWLRADRNIDYNEEPVQNYERVSQKTTIAWDDVLPAGQEPNTRQLVVNRWSSTVGSTYFDHNATTSNERRKPVFISQHYLMNYHPTVDFYAHWIGAGNYYRTNVTGSRTRFSSFLSSHNMPMSTGKPANSSLFAVMNAAVKEGYESGLNNENSYFIFWHSAQTPPTRYGDVHPGLGLRNNAGMGQPRLRVGGGLYEQININSKGFDPGSTTIAEYRLTNIPSNTDRIANGNVIVGFNMNYVTNDLSGNDNGHTGAWYMSTNSSLGGSLYHGNTESRSFKGMITEVVQYEGTLTDLERMKINSYFAIKYGTTLRPAGYATASYPYPRLDYKFSNDTIFWNGATASGKWATFYNNIAAVIRDDAAHLINKQAHSTEVGSIVHIGVPSEHQPQLYMNGTDTGIGQMENDLEAIVIGNDKNPDINAPGTELRQREECGKYEHIFLRRWLVHKKTKNNRPIKLLVGAQNNAHNALGASRSKAESDMYNALVNSNDVFMIVADSPEKLTPGNPAYGEFKAIVPMQYRNGEHQCLYTFADTVTYITFAYKPTDKGCAGEVAFSGSKTLGWSQWTRNSVGETFYNNSGTVTTKTFTESLGNDISAKTTVSYPAGVRADRYYPRVTTSPSGALDLMRRLGANPVTTTIEFTKSGGSATPLIPEFFISGLDARSRQYDQVTVTGYCGNLVVLPEMTYAGNPANASYNIERLNVATVTRNSTQTATATAGRVNVAFKGGVNKVVVEYTLAGRATSTEQHIYISPMTLKPVPPPAIINEDGLSFVEDVYKREITTCEEEEYIFYIGNVNIESKYVNFIDVLPPGLKWHTLTLDSINSKHAHNQRGEDIGNYKIKVHPFDGTNTLKIDSLLIPCASTIKLSATVKIDTNAVTAGTPRTFLNHSRIDYVIILDDEPKDHSLLSHDRFTNDDETSFVAIRQERSDSIAVTAKTNHAAYLANSEIEVTMKVKNNNQGDIADMYLNLSWDAGFTYVEGSFSGTSQLGQPVGTIVTSSVTGDPMISIAANDAGSAGFGLSHGETVFKFKLRAPLPANLEHEYDEHGVEQTNKYATLHVNYKFISEQNDPCITQGLLDNLGEIRVPYSRRTHLVTNKHVTTKFRK